MNKDALVVTFFLALASSSIIGMETTPWLGFAAFISHTVIAVGWKLK